MPAERVEQVAMRRRLDQRALVMLAMDLDQRAADVAHQRHARRLVVDEDARAPVRSLHALQDDVAIVVDGVVGKDGARRMVDRHVEGGGDLSLLRAVAHQRRVAARAERQRQGVKQDRFAGTGLAGQHRKPGGKVDIQPFDQDDIADRQMRQHAPFLRSVPRDLAGLGQPRTAIDSSRGSSPPLCSKA